MVRELAYVAAGLLLLAYVVDFLFSLGDDPREPPRVSSKIPLIGHVVGLMRHGPTYYRRTSEAAGAEIYTLGVGSFKVYVSASSRLLPMIQKESKALSFRPFLQLTARKYGEATDETYRLYGGELPDDLSHSVKMSLVPGPHLDDLSLRMGRRVLVDVDALLDTSGRRGEPVRLLGWVRHAVIQATSCAVYGEKHPFVSPAVEKAYWEWMAYLTAHLVGWLDFTGRGYALRRQVFDAHIEYCRALPDDASYLVREHQRVLGEAGVSDVDKAKQAAIFTIASFSNSAPTLYWTLWELYSRPQILTEVREELETQAVSRSATGEFVLDVVALKSKCPLLLSVLQETQRTRHVNPSFRKVMVDTLLDGKYLLKAGNYLQVPGNVIHAETRLWGDSALEFDPRRFVPGKDAERGAGSTSGFVPWGAAPYLCPARQFAATEILIVVALLALRADLQPARGTMERSPALNFSDLSTLAPPKKDVDMNVALREKWEGRWCLNMSEGKSRISLASG